MCVAILVFMVLYSHFRVFDPKSVPNGRGLPTPVRVARLAAPCVIFLKTGSPERLLSKSYRGEHGALWHRCKKSTFQPCIGSILFKRIRAQGPVGSEFPPLGCPWVPPRPACLKHDKKKDPKILSINFPFLERIPYQ